MIRLWLVTSSKDYQCLVWDIVAKVCVAVAEGHTDAVGAISICHNPATYASRATFMVSGGILVL